MVEKKDGVYRAYGRDENAYRIVKETHEGRERLEDPGVDGSMVLR
jgi:hypothetical protein